MVHIQIICTGYTVENNDFSNPYGLATYGVVVVNSSDGGISSDVNEIYRNTFDGFDYAATAGLANVKMSGPIRHKHRLDIQM